MTLDQLWSGVPGTSMVPLSREATIAELDRGICGDGFFLPSREKQARAVVRAWVPALPLPGRRRRVGP